MILDDVMMMALAHNPLRFRASAQFEGANAVVKPAGITVGDLVFVILRTNFVLTLQTSGGAAWTDHGTIMSNAGIQVFSKVLDATDLANDWTLSSSNQSGAAVAYAAPDNAAPALKDTSVAGTFTDPSLTLSGFTQDANSRGAVSILLADWAAGVTPPSGFTIRLQVTVSSLYQLVVADFGDYSGGDVTWTDLAGSNIAAGGYLFELKGA